MFVTLCWTFNIYIYTCWQYTLHLFSRMLSVTPLIKVMPTGLQLPTISSSVHPQVTSMSARSCSQHPPNMMYVILCLFFCLFAFVFVWCLSVHVYVLCLSVHVCPCMCVWESVCVVCWCIHCVCCLGMYCRYMLFECAYMCVCVVWERVCICFVWAFVCVLFMRECVCMCFV